MILKIKLKKYHCVQSFTLHYTCLSTEDFCSVKSFCIYWNMKVLLSIFYKLSYFLRSKTCWKPVMVKRRTKTFTADDKEKPCSANIFINLHVSCVWCSRKEIYRDIFKNFLERCSYFRSVAYSKLFSARFSE